MKIIDRVLTVDSESLIYSMLFPYTQMRIRDTQFWQRTHKKIEWVPNSVSGTPNKAHGSAKDSWIQNPGEIAVFHVLVCANILNSSAYTMHMIFLLFYTVASDSYSNFYKTLLEFLQRWKNKLILLLKLQQALEHAKGYPKGTFHVRKPFHSVCFALHACW